MKSLSITAATVAMILSTYSVQGQTLLAPYKPSSSYLYNTFLLPLPATGMVEKFWVDGREVQSVEIPLGIDYGYGVSVSPVDQNGNVTITTADGNIVAVPAEMMDDRSIGDLVDAINQVTSQGGFDSTMVSESDYSSADADFGGSGNQDSNGAEYE